MSELRMIVPTERQERNVVPANESAALMQVIARAASDPAFDIAKMQALMAMHKQVKAEQAEVAFNEAMNACQREMGPISADATNPQTKSKYASYAQLDRAVRPIYTRHGFALSFDEGASDKPEYVRVLCRCSHSAGHTHVYQTDMPADGKGARGGDVMTKTHAVAAAKSYGKRYLLKDIFNIAVGEGDLDGNDPRGARPDLPLDVINALKDAAKEGTDQLAGVFKGLENKTRALIVASYPEEWAALKAEAAAVKS